ncbi:type II toxin-antitoxin system VapC family toxin [Sphingobacterium sp. SGG-5]|uniref:type II toxin-antitoxin system VapC family toxin n=1 Tax=Sphingobacterium sp. SGG-5 TaxID=2710881 RepID=UPI0013EB8489|nr:type II toxin-antitoxin system VapC family toxin [Sphingobacterium sp. SGG-5]NGM63135.1 type II toxin-antitoxin system VapC family toxin [Sphingobacterium sp. SGG-5]
MKTTGSNYLLDTNIVIEVFSGNRDIADKLHQLDTFFISATILGELHVGINRVVNRTKHLKKLINFLTLCDVALVDTRTSEIFGEVSAQLYKKGKPIPSNDVWISATALQYDFTLVTRDKHFSEVEKLKVEMW